MSTPRHPRHSCQACTELQRLAIRRRDPELVAEAIRLRQVHEANDEDRGRYVKPARGRLGRAGRPPRETTG